MTAESGGMESTHQSGKMSPGEVAMFLGLLLLAAILRMGWPGLTEFKADEARLLTAALEMNGGEFALRGISSSVGFPNAPMSVWLYSAPLVLWQHPYAATLFTGLLSVAAVTGVYWLGRRYWGANAAIVAALLLAVSPWAILFSRKIWAQNLLPIFAVGWAIAAVLAFVEDRRAFIVLHLLCLAIAAQIHPAALGLAPATLLFLFVYRHRIDWRLFLLGGMLSLLTAAPFLWYLWQRGQSEGGLPFSTGQSTAEISLDSIRLVLSLVVGEGLRPLAGANYAGLPGETVIRLLWLALIIGGVSWAIIKSVRHWSEPVAQVGFICLAWFLGPAILFIWHRTPVYIHYFIVALPAPYLLVGAVYADVMKQLQARWVAWVTIGMIAALQLAVWISLMTAVAGDPTAGGFGIPLGVKVAAADRARELASENGADEILVVGDGSDPEQDDFPAIFRALLHDVAVRYVDLNMEAVFPGAAAIALLDTAAADSPTSTRDLYVAASLHSSDIHGPGRIEYTLHAIGPSAAPEAGYALPQPALLANFVRLTGYNALRFNPSGAIWDVFWLPADNPDPADYHIFNHLQDDSGMRVSQADAPAFAGSQWQPGDVVINRFFLPLSAEPQSSLSMRVGMYRYPSLENVPVLDEAANPAADALVIPLRE